MYGIAIVRSRSFLFPDDFDGNANNSVAIKSGSTVSASITQHCYSLGHNDRYVYSATVLCGMNEST